MCCFPMMPSVRTKLVKMASSVVMSCFGTISTVPDYVIPTMLSLYIGHIAGINSIMR